MANAFNQVHILSSVSLLPHRSDQTRLTDRRPCSITVFMNLIGGWLVVSLFIYLFICWSSRMTALLLCYHSIAPCTSKGGISASAICRLWRFVFSFNIQVGLNRLPLAALVAFSMALHSALLHRGYSQRIGGR